MGPIDEFFKRAGLGSKPKKKRFFEKHLNVILPAIFTSVILVILYVMKLIGFVSF
jgi:hypothetical protein